MQRYSIQTLDKSNIFYEIATHRLRFPSYLEFFKVSGYLRKGYPSGGMHGPLIKNSKVTQDWFMYYHDGYDYLYLINPEQVTYLLLVCGR